MSVALRDGDFIPLGENEEVVLITLPHGSWRVDVKYAESAVVYDPKTKSVEYASTSDLGHGGVIRVVRKRV